MNFAEKPKYEHILLAIDDKIQLIDKANEALKRHKGDVLQETQYNELKEQFTKELQELLSIIFLEHNISLKLSA